MASAIARQQDRLIDDMTLKGLSYVKDTTFSWRELADSLKAGS